MPSLSSAPPTSFHEPGLAGRMPTLDGFRGIAVLLVIVAHLTFLDRSAIAAERAIGTLAGFGWSGVELFFVLSGFLITGILLDARDERTPHYFRDFYARRALRIFPLYYAILFVILVALRHWPLRGHLPASFGDAGVLSNHAPSDAWYWLYASNFLFAIIGPQGTLGPTWSLAIEEQFYLAWPAIVLLCSRRALFRTCLGLIAIAILCRAGLSMHGITYPAGYVLTPCHTDGLAVGAIIALLARTSQGLLTHVRTFASIGAASAIALLAIAIALAIHHVPLRESTWAQPILYTLIALISGAALVLAACATPDSLLGRTLGHRLPRALGKYSYALYLLNLPVEQAMRRLLKFETWHPLSQRFPSQLPAQLTAYLVNGVILFVVAWLSWHLYESQFLKLKRFFPSSAAAPQPTAEQ